MNQLRASDLRLGNLVLFRGKICKVTTLSGDIIRVSEPAVGIIEQAYAKSPIELTPEILEACGFVVTGTIGATTYSFGDNEITKDWLIELEFIPEYELFYRNAKFRIQYVHQLQNLYYSLTGEELTISLPTVKLEEG